MKPILLALSLALTGCMASYAVQTRHDAHRQPTPEWRVGLDMTAMLAGGAVAVLAPEGPHYVGVAAGLGVWAVDMIAVIATGRKD